MTRASTRNKTAVVVAPRRKATVGRIAVADAATKKKNGEDQENRPTTDQQQVVKPPSRRISNEFDRTGDTLYMSAIDL